MVDNTELIPDESEVVFDDETIRNAAKRPELPLGWHKFIVDSVERGAYQEGKLRGGCYLSLRLSALKNPDDPTQRAYPSVYERINLPINNPRVDGHKAPKWFYDRTQVAFNALYDPNELVRRPGIEDGEYYFDNKVIKREQVDKCRERALGAVVKMASKVFFKDPEGLVDRVFYGLLETRKDKNSDREFRGIQQWVNCEYPLPDNAELVDLTEAQASAPPPEVVPAVKPKKARKRK